jgi:hypothetical protein
MLTTVEGVYRDGRIKLLDKPRRVREAPVLVTFLRAPKGKRPRKLTRAERVELRARLVAWEEDWNAPGMEAYDAL